MFPGSAAGAQALKLFTVDVDDDALCCANTMHPLFRAIQNGLPHAHHSGYTSALQLHPPTQEAFTTHAAQLPIFPSIPGSCPCDA